MNISLLSGDELRLLFISLRSPVYAKDVCAFAATCVAFHFAVRENRQTLVDEHCEVNAFCHRFPMLPTLPNSRKKVLSVADRNKWWSWEDASLNTREITTLAKILNSGAVGECKHLKFYNVELSDPYTSILVDALACVPFNTLQSLGFFWNEIHTAAISIWMSVFASGAMPELQSFVVFETDFSDITCAELAEACDRGAFKDVCHLQLYDASIGDTGLECIADACARGAFDSVSELNLLCNKFGDIGCTALANALSSGALRSLEILFVEMIDHPQLRASCEERGIAVIPIC